MGEQGLQRPGKQRATVHGQVLLGQFASETGTTAGGRDHGPDTGHQGAASSSASADAGSADAGVAGTGSTTR